MNNTYLLPNLPSNITLPQLPLLDGQIMAKLESSVQVVEDEFIMSETLENFTESSLIQPLEKKLCVTQESVVATKKEILKDKSSISKKSTQTLKSLKTLARGSTTTDQDLRPFWKESTLAVSKQLWSPTKTDSQDLQTNLWNGSLKRIMSKSWFSTRVTQPIQQKNLQTTCCPSLQSLLQETMELEQENTESNELLRAYKVQIYPDQKQKLTLKKWFGVQRWIYNRCLAEVKNNACPLKEKDLRERVVSNKNFEFKNTWLLDYEYDLRDEAMRDFLKNYKSNLTKSKILKTPFTMKFKTKKDAQSLNVLGKKWNKPNNFYTEIFQPSEIHSAEPLPLKLSHTCRLMLTPTKKYYISIPVTKNENQIQKTETEKVISIDPGVKNFMTGYDPSGLIITVGQKDIGRIARLLHYQNQLQSKMSKITTSKKKKSHKMAWLRMGEKIRNLVDDLHKKLAKWLCEEYNTILIPRLNFHDFKNLNKKSKKQLATFSHCSFLDRLIYKSQEYSNCRVIEVTEEYTSKTCTCCGTINESLGNKDILTCECGVTIERDFNGARNILLKYLTERHSVCRIVASTLGSRSLAN